MARKTASARNAERIARENLKAHNAKLEEEVEGHRREIEQLHHQLAAASERLESATGELNELEMRLVAVVGEKNEIQRELDLILEQRDLSQRKAQCEKEGKKKWIFPAAAVTAILVASTVALWTCSKKN